MGVSNEDVMSMAEAAGSERFKDTGRPGRRILIVDDAEDNRFLFSYALHAAGYEVEEASNGEEAIERVANRAPDLIVMDLCMPVLDGFETTRRLKRDPDTSHIVVLVVTALTSKDQVSKARHAGADAISAKPCTPRSLLGQIEELLRAA